MELVKEITVFLENHPGALARVTHSLGEHGINIYGFTLTNALDHGALRMVVSAPAEALHLFGEHNLLAIEHDILMVSLPNEANALAKLADKLSETGVNIEYAYGSADSADQGPACMFLRVSDVDAAQRVLSAS